MHTTFTYLRFGSYEQLTSSVEGHVRCDRQTAVQKNSVVDERLANGDGAIADTFTGRNQRLASQKEVAVAPPKANQLKENPE